MPGRWTVSVTDDLSHRVTYFDHSTKKRWVCGQSPPSVSERDVLAWILSHATFGDLLVVSGMPWMLYPCEDDSIRLTPIMAT